ncbi:methylated-DNA--[protein]-cysteine S-methyltransferase [Homoserinibacter sp. YIM 151385]|uniref:methylated-DNA--[protein]-cysteine S-methyltransferase n=1 Tax=Homoserinibacter sp. YIM 151385 TaxID=2985506 RepID=UPI0022F056C2|nr:methylated-DNA--[protein]-cysteine S-methyltransferase [Homoserinibacter sp. YIM 151385]WBU38298.1 methylated-DNA--[protein]-cysteine S-methyltransferase [Homoserinibacter sp. YIM 151385]
MKSPETAPASIRRLDSPIGRIELGGDGVSVVSLSIERDGRLPHDGLPEQSDDVLDRAAAQLAEYFAGDRRDFDVPVDLRGTAFQLSVWEQLVELEWGEVVSYGEIGRATGRETAGRAVGGAVGANPVPIIVPCHRVLAGDGRITGYSGGEGIATKSWLLAHEGIAHSVPAAAVQTALEGLDETADAERDMHSQSPAAQTSAA